MPQAARALDALLRGLIDYAGLFPPAAHDMAETVATLRALPARARRLGARAGSSCRRRG